MSEEEEEEKKIGMEERTGEERGRKVERRGVERRHP